MSEVAQKEWFGHPRGLSTLFFTEMWERFSYYGMRGILILFMVAAIEDGGFGMGEATAAAIYGLYTAGVYLLALPGGWIADHLIGQRKAVFLGGCIIAAGHFSMAVPSQAMFYLGLVLIVIGTGLLKPNVSAIVGDLYPGDSGARRDAGFSIFYMGINIGAFAGPIVCGWLGEDVSWHAGFGAAGVGMVAGLIQYSRGGQYLGDAGSLKTEVDTSAEWRKFFIGLAIVIAAIPGAYYASKALGPIGLSLGSLEITIDFTTLLGTAGSLGIVIVTLAIVYFASVIFFGGLTTAEKKRVFVIFLLFIGAALFWSGFEQAGSSMNLFAERLTDRTFFGWEMPASWLQSVNPLFIILLAPVFGWLWVRLQNSEPSIPMKFGYGLILLGIGFFVMAWGSTYTGDGLVSPAWLVVTYFFHTCGELCLSPVGLSSVTKLSPPKFVGQMMGTWFMGAALGNLVAGLVAGQIESKPLPDLFSTVAWIVVISGAVFIVLTPLIKKMIGKLD